MEELLSINALRAIFTVLGLVSFVALTAWVYAGKRRHAFDAAARLPLAEAAPADTCHQE